MRGSLSGVNAIRLAIAETTATLVSRTSRVTPPESDRREQQEDCKEVKGATTDPDELDFLPRARRVWQHLPPAAPIEQWPSPSAPAIGIRQPERQFKPPHHNRMKTAKWSRTILSAAGQLTRIVSDFIRLAFRKSSILDPEVIWPNLHYCLTQLVAASSGVSIA